MPRRRIRLAALAAAALLVGAAAHARGAEKGGGLSPGWTAEEWKLAREMSPLPPPPLDPTNALSGSDRAARLGHRLFFDRRLSPHAVACASCHLPEKGMGDGLKVGNTLAPLHRNTMTIVNAAYYRWLTWDGARDSLWHQAVGPVESPQEMGSSRLYVVRTVMRFYGNEFAALARLHEGWDALWPRLPASGKPGEVAWDRLPAKEKDAANRAFTAVLKVIAAYERRIVSKASPFDRYVAGEADALSAGARRGFRLFVRFQCTNCHSTPLFSDDEFHNLGLPSVPVADAGRREGLPKLQRSLFRGTGPYADGEPFVRPEDYRAGRSSLGAFRTPSLREVAATGPYGHNGSVATLEEWLDHYEKLSRLPKDAYLGRLDPSLPDVRMTAEEKKDLVAFLRALSSDWRSAWTRSPEGMPSR